MFARHIIQNKKFMSNFDDIPTRKEKKRISILKLSEKYNQKLQDLLIDKKGVTDLESKTEQQKQQAIQQKDQSLVQLIYSLKELITISTKSFEPKIH